MDKPMSGEARKMMLIDALRLTATENNIAYRTADHERWQDMDFVIGIEIKPSNNHPVVDVCDELCGVYPKTFKFVGWHPFCRCIAVPKLADEDEFIARQQALIDGEDDPAGGYSGEVTEMPECFTRWVEEHADKIDTAKSIPYFIRDNREQVDDVLDMTSTIIKVGNDEYTLRELISQCSVVETTNGKVYLHPDHGKGEIGENLEFARWRAEGFGEKVILLPNPQGVKSPDSYNITRGVLEEYKLNCTPTKNSIDNLLRSGKRQANHIILEIDSNISAGDLRDIIQDRITRSENFKELRLKIGNAEAIYTRAQIMANDFKLKPEDFRNASILRSRGTWLTSKEAVSITDAKVAKFFELDKKIQKENAIASVAQSLNKENQAALAKALGITPGKEMTFEEANEMRGNPNYKKAAQFRKNCQSSVVANEMRRRGFDVEAYGNNKKEWHMPSILSRKPEIAFVDAKGELPTPIAVRFNGDLVESLREEMKEPGRYHLRFRFENDNGHIITAERLTDGSLRIYDPQSGKIIKDFSEFASKVNPNSFEYYRVDNLEINPMVAKGVVKPRGAKGDAPRMSLPEITASLEKGWFGGDYKPEYEPLTSPSLRKRLMEARNKQDKLRIFNELKENKEFVEEFDKELASVFVHPGHKTKDAFWPATKQMGFALSKGGREVLFLPESDSTTNADALMIVKGFPRLVDFKYSTTTKPNTLQQHLAEGFNQADTIVLKLENMDAGQFRETIEYMKRNKLAIGDILLINQYDQVMELSYAQLKRGRYINKIRGFLR